MLNPLKHGALQIKLVSTKPTKNETPAPEPTPVDTAEIAKIATDAAVKIIGAIGIAFAANRILTSVCEVAVHVAKAKL